MASTKDDPPTSIIKSDRTGRMRYTQQYKDAVLAAYEGSGMSGPAFAEHCGLKYPTFAGWVARRRRENGQVAPSAGDQKFVLAEFGTAAGAGALRVELPGGAAAELSSPAQAGLLADLIRALTA